MPKEAAADLFVLHAPLELIGRAGLLPLVRPAVHDQARLRVLGRVDSFVDAGTSVAPPAPVATSSVPEAASFLVKATEAGDVDEVDRYAAWLGATTGAWRASPQ